MIEMSGKIKGNIIELGMRCDTLAKDLVLTDVTTLLEIKNSLERLLHIVENTLFDLDLLEDRVEQTYLEIGIRTRKNEISEKVS
ncbi:MAG: hypothetical protein DRN29_04870 [Thermoplasmata archaeon]|nr:MAG: hypothetical protein DRN29_04870 [Thermoplasmata archaeon]